MFKKRLYLLVFSLFSISWCFAGMLETGTFELGASGKSRFINEEGNFATDFQLMLGYFPFNNIAVGGIFTETSNAGHGVVGIGPYGEYNFTFDSPFVPYVGLKSTVNVGHSHYSAYLIFEGTAGCKLMISEAIAALLEVYYDIAGASIYIENGSSKNTDSGLRAGLRAYF